MANRKLLTVETEGHVDMRAPTIDVDDWSDPLIAMQVQSFIDYVQSAQSNGTVSAVEELEKTSEYLCEWSRNLLNRMFARTTHSELCQVQQVFETTADLVDGWAAEFPNAPQTLRIKAYSQHIRDRTGLRLVH
jgi:hypothetical protein